MIADTPLQLSPTNGTFVISLDFELYWGMFDQTELTPEFKDVLLRTREEVIPQMLEMFEQYGIHATWASVGFLFFEDKETLLAGLPTTKATYTDESLSAYHHLASVGANEQADPFHFAPSLVKMIQSYSNQEIGSHSFSHYYCLEEGQSPAMFKADIEAWSSIAKRYGVEAASICFARNQYSPSYLSACRDHQIKAYRGNEDIWFYRPDSYNNESISRKIFRWLDTYLPLTAHQCLSLQQVKQQSLSNYPENLYTDHLSMVEAIPTSTKLNTSQKIDTSIQSCIPQPCTNRVGQSLSEEIYNIRSSRFLRAYFHKLRWLEPLKQRRILTGMTHAAKQKRIYHLWWHPQDFGQDSKENFQMLTHILEHYTELRKRYGMVSATMSEIASSLEETKSVEKTKSMEKTKGTPKL